MEVHIFSFVALYLEGHLDAALLVSIITRLLHDRVVLWARTLRLLILIPGFLLCILLRDHTFIPFPYFVHCGLNLIAALEHSLRERHQNFAKRVETLLVELLLAHLVLDELI